MKNLNNFVFEKLKINRDVKLPKDYLNNICKLIKGKNQDEYIRYEIKNCIQTWLGNDYNKKLYCYIYQGFKYFYKDINIDKDVIDINYIDLDTYTKSVKYATRRVYGNVKDDPLVEFIECSQYSMRIEFKNRTYGFLLEKTKI